MAVLKLYVHLCYQNRIVSSQMLTASYDSQSLYDIIKRHLNRCKPLASRMLAAKWSLSPHHLCICICICIAQILLASTVVLAVVRTVHLVLAVQLIVLYLQFYLHAQSWCAACRRPYSTLEGVTRLSVTLSWCFITLFYIAPVAVASQVLPTLVSCCKPGHMARDRIDGAEIIAYLTEVDVQLQHQASITDHCIPALASFFKECKSPGLDVKVRARLYTHYCSISRCISVH